MSYFFILIGFILLIKCADIFVSGCSSLAKVFRIPTIIIGLTIVAFGTSAPEASVSLIASLKGSNTISVGNIVGSTICTLLLVLGISSLFGYIKIEEKVLKRDYSYSLLAYIILFLMTVTPFIFGYNISRISKFEGSVLLVFIIVYLIMLYNASKSKKESVRENFKFKYIINIIIGLIGIILGGDLVVDNATIIAKTLGVSNNVIALTIVAIGTSLPELVTSAVATYKNETDIAIGNIIGSNIFNIFFILGLSGVIGNITLEFESLMDIIIMNLTGILVLILLYKNKQIDYKKGIFMLSLYIIYIIYILIR